MDSNQPDESTPYQVVVNHEGQYSIWPQHLRCPEGWKIVGAAGNKSDCLAQIKETWKDMRPLSLLQNIDKTRPKDS